MTTSNKRYYSLKHSELEFDKRKPLRGDNPYVGEASDVVSSQENFLQEDSVRDEFAREDFLQEATAERGAGSSVQAVDALSRTGDESLSVESTAGDRLGVFVGSAARASAEGASRAFVEGAVEAASAEIASTEAVASGSASTEVALTEVVVPGTTPVDPFLFAVASSAGEGGADPGRASESIASAVLPDSPVSSSVSPASFASSASSGSIASPVRQSVGAGSVEPAAWEAPRRKSSLPTVPIYSASRQSIGSVTSQIHARGGGAYALNTSVPNPYVQDTSAQNSSAEELSAQGSFAEELSARGVAVSSDRGGAFAGSSSGSASGSSALGRSNTSAGAFAGSSVGSLSRVEVSEMIDEHLAATRFYVLESDITKAQKAVKSLVELSTF